MKRKTYHGIKMAQKEHALTRFYETNFIGSRKTWSAKFQVDVKEERGEGV